MVEIPAGTHVRMRVTRRYASYNVGDVIAVPFFQGKELEAKRLAQPIDLLVPTARTPPPAGQDSATAAPARQAAQVVRK